MPSVKPTVDRDQLITLIEGHFGQQVTDLEPLDGGEIAHTVAFAVGGEEYVLRLHAQVMGANFEKEAYIALHIDSSVPIPSFVHIGRLGDFPYAISKRSRGQRMNTLPPSEVEALLPRLFETLDAIHRSAMPATPGFGFFNDRGIGTFPSWRSSLTAIREEEPA